MNGILELLLILRTYAVEKLTDKVFEQMFKAWFRFKSRNQYSLEYISTQSQKLDEQCKSDVNKALRRHFRVFDFTRQNYNIEEVFLLTDSDENKSIPEFLRIALGQLHKNIREKIEFYAQEKEKLEQLPLRHVIRESAFFSQATLNRAEMALNIEKDIQVSLKTIEEILKTASDSNKSLINLAENAQSESEKIRYLLMNGIFVYELNSYMIDQFEKFMETGILAITQLDKFYEEIESTSHYSLQLIKEARDMAEVSSIDDEERTRLINEQNKHEEWINAVLNEWREYTKYSKEIETKTKERLKVFLETLKVRRASAKARISTISIASLQLLAKEQFVTLDRIVDLSKEIELARFLDPPRLERLMSMTFKVPNSIQVNNNTLNEQVTQT